MADRPLDFRLNYGHPLAQGLVLAGLGRHSGTTHYRDSSLYGNDGTLTNMDPATDWVWSNELGRWALAFDGSNQEIPISGTSDIFDGINVLSIAGWINPYTQATTSSPAWINNGHTTPLDILGASFGAGWQVFLNGANRLSGSVAVTLDVWTHIAVTWDGVTVRVFKNGVHQTALDGSYSTALNTTTNLVYLGDKAGGTARGFIGRMSDQLIWPRRAITNSEIASLADPSNVMLSGMLLPPTRRLFGAVTAAPPSNAVRLIDGGPLNSEIFNGGLSV